MATAAPWSAVVRALAPHVLPRRLARMRAQLRFRVADSCLVLENVADPLNAAACLRTADALGVQHVHVISRFVSPKLLVPGATSVDRGTAKWLSVSHHDSTASCLVALRRDGWLVAATDMSAEAVEAAAAAALTLALPRPRPLLQAQALSLEHSPPGAPRPAALLRPRVAIVLGNEHRGVSRLACESADVRFFIAQLGFVQSLNISVACGLALHVFLHRTKDFAARAQAAHALRVDSDGTDAAVAAALAALAEIALRAERDGGAVCESLSDDEVEAVVARNLMLDIKGADAVLDRLGLRPPDF